MELVRPGIVTISDDLGFTAPPLTPLPIVRSEKQMVFDVPSRKLPKESERVVKAPFPPHENPLASAKLLVWLLVSRAPPYGVDPPKL